MRGPPRDNVEEKLAATMETAMELFEENERLRQLMGSRSARGSTMPRRRTTGYSSSCTICTCKFILYSLDVLLLYIYIRCTRYI